MKKKRLFGIAVILAVAAVLIFAGGWLNRKWDLSDVEHLHFRNDSLYLVDRGDDGCLQIVQSDTEGANGRMILCDINEKDVYRSAEQMFFDDQGGVYLLMKETDDLKSSLVVYFCDFDTGRLTETDYDVSAVTGQSSNVYIQGIRGDSLYFFVIPYNSTEEAVLCATAQSGETEELDTVAVQYPYLKNQFFLSENNVILWMDYKGEIFVKPLGTDQYLEIEGITGVTDSFWGMSDDGRNTAYIFDYKTDCIREINLEDLSSSVVYSAEQMQDGFSFSTLVGPSCTSAGFCGAVRDDKGAEEVILYFDQEGSYCEIFEVSLTLGAIWQEIAIYAAVVLLLAGALCIYWYIYCKYRVQSIFLRIIVVFLIGMFCADYFIGYWVSVNLQEHFQQNQTMALSAIASQVESQIASRLEQDPDQFPSSDDSLEVGQNDSGRNDLEDSVVGYTFGILRADSEGKLRVYESMTEYSNVPVEWCYPDDCVAALYQAFETGESVHSMVQNEKGLQNILFIPIVFSDGTVYGVLSLSAEGGFMEYQTWYYERNIRILSVVMLLVISVIMIVILIVFLMPLKKLKHCAEQLEAGEMGATVPVHGHNEIANIAAAFNKMSLGIASYVQDMQDMSAGYYKFVPAKILRLLGKESIKEVQLGDEISEKMTILALHTSDYRWQRHDVPAGERYRDINRFLSILITPITRHHGVVEHFEDSGLSAFFTDNSREALDAAIEMHQALNEETGNYTATVAVTYGSVMIGVIGSEERMEAATISAHTNLAKALRLEGEKYGAKILATHLIYQQIPEFDKKYHARYLGNVYIAADRTLERVYDVYDGDPEEEFYYKELTKPLFEQGVELFVARKFYDARLVFVEVLKQHRRDKAAKEYLYRCDNYYRMDDPKEADTLLGRF